MNSLETMVFSSISRATLPAQSLAMLRSWRSVAFSALLAALAPAAGLRVPPPALSASAPSTKLVIWDCDGCLVDSEALLKTAEVEALRAAGFDQVTEDDCNRLFSGYAPEAGAARFLEEYGEPVPENFFRDQIANSADLFRARLEQLNAKTVLALHAAGRRQVVASGSPRERVLVCLEKAGIAQCFTAEQVFTREDVPGRGKPNPDMFQLAASKMGVEAADCVVVEDSTSGIKAAQAAEMEVVGYLGGGHAQSDWYRETINGFGIPLVYSDTELLEYLS